MLILSLIRDINMSEMRINGGGEKKKGNFSVRNLLRTYDLCYIAKERRVVARNLDRVP